MYHFTLSAAEKILLSGYVFFFMGLNGTAFLISSFYRRKFDQSSPSISFLLSLALSALFLISIVSGLLTDPLWRIVSILSLLGSAISSAISMIGLYFIMRSIRK
ncbi:hypothetical protein CHISP_2404 [Chitinispirillum alkaliphilum]|nr:hypothetical protein CHISP_2404 [Chitinispirillum alkaliphilum]